MMRIKNGYKIRNIAGESIIVAVGTHNVNLTKVITLNPTSVWLWEELGNDEFDTAKVATLLVENYEIDLSKAKSDAEAWIESLREADLIED